VNEITFRPNAAQRPGVQRRAVESEKTFGTKPLSKMPAISGREARPLQRRVSRQPRDALDENLPNG
jgi:hypothetical protein